MSERKVLNKYYPPDFDPSKIPKLRLPRNRQYSIRIMAPFNMRCGTCGEYIYKGKKFNSRKETVEDENYLGLHIFRFYIKCPRCVAEIAFKTDPENTDYTLEAGATRNFEALRTAEEMAKREQKEKEAEEKNNPMKVLENRTKSSLQEMQMIETLEELRDLNSRHAKVDHEEMLKLHKAYEEQLLRLQDEEDEELIRSVFGKTDDSKVKRLRDSSDEDDVCGDSPKVKTMKTDKPTDILTQESNSEYRKPADKKPAAWERSVGGLSSGKNKLQLLVKRKTNQTDKKTAKTSQSDRQTSTTQPDTEASKNEGHHGNNSAELKGSDSVTCNQIVSPSGGENGNNSVTGNQTVPPSSGGQTTITTKTQQKPGSSGTPHQSRTDSSGTLHQSSSGLTGLGMLGGYSDSDDSGNDSE